MKSLDTKHISIADSASGEHPRQKEQPLAMPPKAAPSPASSQRLDTEYMSTQSQPSEPAEGRLPDGYLLQNRYRILGIRGIGGMSTVYKAQDLRFSKVTRFCAVKQMLNTATDPQVREMIRSNFEREANILAALSHPGIVQVFDFFSEGDRSYLVLEYVDGKDLEVVLSETDGFLSEAQVVSWTIQVCEVLSYLHSHDPQPIVFRDMKPANLMLDSHGRIRVLDFGIAKIFQSGQKGTMIGTEGYTPQEQYRGIAEPRVDIYALGATMHHLLSKQDPRLEPPFSFHERPISRTNPTVSRELTEIINRALEYDPNDRFGSAEEMQRALMSLASARGRSRTGPFGTTPFAGSEVMALWRFRCEDEVRSSPAVHDGIVYIGAYDNNIYAVSAENGKFLWKYATEGGIASSPCVHEGRVFFGSSDRLLYALNAETGRISWTCPTQAQTTDTSMQPTRTVGAWPGSLRQTAKCVRRQPLETKPSTWGARAESSTPWTSVGNCAGAFVLGAVLRRPRQSPRTPATWGARIGMSTVWTSAQGIRSGAIVPGELSCPPRLSAKVWSSSARRMVICTPWTLKAAISSGGTVQKAR